MTLTHKILCIFSTLLAPAGAHCTPILNWSVNTPPEPTAHRMQQEVLLYWFGPLLDEQSVPLDRIAFWFGQNDCVDAEIRSRFAYLIEQAEQGHLEHWKSHPRGRLALILLLDQFPRNIFRGTEHAFAYDDKAVNIALEGLVHTQDHALLPIERVFFYLPLEHSEDLAMQERSVELFHSLHEQSKEETKEIFAQFLRYAERHHEIIARFGRFPHRNQIMSRQSTEEELEFLKEPNSSF